MREPLSEGEVHLLFTIGIVTFVALGILWLVW